MLLPGPEAMQLATYAGWLGHGVRGGLVAGILFVLPGALVITALSAAYLVAGDVPLVQGLLFGLKAAVLAVVLEALIKLSRRAIKGPLMALIALAAFVGIAFLKIPFPLIIVLAATAGAALHWVGGTGGGRGIAASPQPAAAVPGWARPSARRFVVTTVTWLAIWFGPLLAIAAVAGGAHVYAQEAGFFSKMATVTFGGAYAVLAYVAQQAVEVHGWLRPDEMLTGLGLAETTPGPLILVLVFVGFLGGARLAGLEPLVGGLGGAFVTLWFTFVPCFLWIFAGAPYVETVRARSGEFRSDGGRGRGGSRAGADRDQGKHGRRLGIGRAGGYGGSACGRLAHELVQSNRLETDSSLAVREIASPIRSAIVTTRTLCAAWTPEVGWMESVITSSLSLEPAIRATAPPESTPWVI
jgi:chromate transporter